MGKKKPVGYTNVVPGNESTPLVEVLAFTAEQEDVRRRLISLVAKIAEGEQAYRDVQKLRAKCTHHVFNDRPGFPYDTRHCSICGAAMGLL